MSENFNYKEVPHGYTHCMNEQCPRSAECLRFLVGLHISKETPTFSQVNPAYVEEQGECRYFREIRTIRLAFGFKRIFDNLPHKKAEKIRDIIYRHFGRNTYYRSRSQERPIQPKDQDFILQTFIKEGIEEAPVFEKYIDQYDWS